MKRANTLFVAAALGICAMLPAVASAEDVRNETPSAAAMSVDLVVVRPLSLVMTVLGTGIYIVQLPFAAIQQDFSTPAQKLIVDPARYTFTRPLGEMD